MALTLIAAAGFQSGVESDETGINIESYSCRYFPEVNRSLLNKTGERRGAAVSTIPSGEVTITGEVSGGTGLMAATFITATTIANDAALFGRSAGIWMMQEATESQGREEWRKCAFQFRADPNITAV